ncbi:MAG: hypothetical protein V3V16_08895 [Melioribacteraceae bacterium]
MTTEIIFLFIFNALAIGTGIFVVSNNSRKSLVVFTCYLIITLAFQSYQSYLFLNEIDSIFLFHIYPILEFIFLVAILIIWNPTKKMVYIIWGGLVGAYILGNSIMMPFTEFPAISLLVTYVTLFFMFFYFLTAFMDDVVLKEASHFTTTVSTAFIIYFMSILIGLLPIYIGQYSSLHYIHIVAQLLFYIVIIYAFISEYIQFNKQKNTISRLELYARELKESGTFRERIPHEQIHLN